MRLKQNRSFSNKFRMFMAGSDTYFLEMSVHVSLKGATTDYFSVKQTIKS